MATVVVAPYNVVTCPEVGGHFHVYMQYAQGLRLLGCDVYWLETFLGTGDAAADAALVRNFLRRMEGFGLSGKVILHAPGHPEGPFLGLATPAAEAVLRRADLLLNFAYRIDPALLARFRRTALIDIDPGLLQFWISAGQITVPRHDLYFTTGETVGTAGALFPDCGLPWVRIRPSVCLECWPYTYDPRCEAFTTISSWWGDEWITDGVETYENNKRVTFLEFIEVPKRAGQVLELALYLGEGDRADLERLARHGWRVRHSLEVAAGPEAYQAYIRGSRGEFSCAKPSCMKFQNAWVSDRSLCYLASGKPVVVQDTGPSAYLPNGEGMFRFKTVAEAVGALETVNADYERHCRAAREIAEAHFDARKVLAGVLNTALGAAPLLARRA
ncbi:MAG TPA: hypothetical protein VFW33_21895 [Gemmataceae bacterium]|nr:hypothetical protein [Gemmataceae bacterium]